MMAHKKTVDFVEVEHKDDPVLCPKCEKKGAEKQTVRSTRCRQIPPTPKT